MVDAILEHTARNSHDDDPTYLKIGSEKRMKAEAEAEARIILSRLTDSIVVLTTIYDMLRYIKATRIT
jgi:hypothetical protein